MASGKTGCYFPHTRSAADSLSSIFVVQVTRVRVVRSDFSTVIHTLTQVNYVALRVKMRRAFKKLASSCYALLTQGVRA
jgi:hypothetical protein